VGVNGEIPDVKQLRIPVKYLANLLTAGDRRRWCARWNACWPCAPTSASKHVDGAINLAVLEPGRPDPAQVEDMYHVMAIANYEDRFVIPTTHREYAENAFNVRGGCGFSFGNGCSEACQRDQPVRQREEAHHPIKAEV
jgi:nitrate reductase beta subunit